MSTLFVSAKEDGNTFKVLSAVSLALGSDFVTAADPIFPQLKKYDTIVLGSGVYANRVHRNLLSWLDILCAEDFKEGSKVYLFMTWIGRGSSNKATFNSLASYLAEKNIDLQPSWMECYGNMKKLIWPSHPNEQDILKVIDWAKGL
ncbi:hypothetical protein SpiGrapes_2765 [Sphaerochaeta pleomorpha str. Grapes]|uniref:Flavodoxin n=1 Tax=Sphaerochaeta pleomorpha (strain ATCC BAA-1885 / DSM 22778 / Grapes) TaxID=158190 RepID=G8QVZ8_SPHPG|nr:hypothetical protein [Sphaerochaeta pleomorpha]AEV30522.1 hypothetical protein SpiGrapes_2765 [Sphaerochaeta pleomorpha str. Grapes]